MAVEVAVARRLFTREECHRMGEVGIIKPTVTGAATVALQAFSDVSLATGEVFA